MLFLTKMKNYLVSKSLKLTFNSLTGYLSSLAFHWWHHFFRIGVH